MRFARRSALTLPNPLTGNARFAACFYTGNAPDLDADSSVVGENVDVVEMTFHDSQDSGTGIHDHYNGECTMFYTDTALWLKWETGTVDGSERHCGEFTGKRGVLTSKTRRNSRFTGSVFTTSKAGISTA